MYLKIQKINTKIIKKSEEYFSDSFCNKLKNQKSWTYNESLVARYLLAPFLNKEGFWGWSISHKKNLVFIWTNNSKIWVDIEILKKRDENILEKFLEKEYKILWEKEKQGTKDPCWKNWKIFYILWTAKEAIIKFENLLLDDMEKIILEKSENINENFSEIKFNKKLVFSFKNKNFIVYSGNSEDIFYSICFLKKIW